jgi:hypothetical protein
LFPTLKGVAIVIYRERTLVKKEPATTGMQVFTAISWDGVGLFQIISGVQLIQSIQLIRRFFKDKKEGQYIDTDSLWRHSLAFGLYLFCCVANYSVYTVTIFAPDSQQLWDVYLGCKILFSVGQFVSEGFLCVIFWQLGSY